MPFAHDASSLARMDMPNLTCSAGDFDIVFSPAGSPAGYDDLAPHSVLITVGDQDVRVASLADVVRSREEAGREKDIRTLPALRRYLRDHADQSPGPTDHVDT